MPTPVNDACRSVNALVNAGPDFFLHGGPPPVHHERNFRNGGHTGAAAMSARGNDRVLVAFDPGISGAAAFHTVETGQLLTAEDLPVVAGQADAVSLANRLSEMKPVAAFVERVSAMPKQGVSSTFKFGQANGVLIGILAALHVPAFHHAEHLEEALRAGHQQGKISAEGLAALSRIGGLLCEEERSQQG
jgi:hypothetical protein